MSSLAYKNCLKTQSPKPKQRKNTHTKTNKHTQTKKKSMFCGQLKRKWPRWPTSFFFFCPVEFCVHVCVAFLDMCINFVYFRDFNYHYASSSLMVLFRHLVFDGINSVFTRVCFSCFRCFVYLYFLHCTCNCTHKSNTACNNFEISPSSNAFCPEKITVLA